MKIHEQRLLSLPPWLHVNNLLPHEYLAPFLMCINASDILKVEVRCRKHMALENIMFSPCLQTCNRRGEFKGVCVLMQSVFHHNLFHTCGREIIVSMFQLLCLFAVYLSSVFFFFLWFRNLFWLNTYLGWLICDVWQLSLNRSVRKVLTNTMFLNKNKEKVI